MTGYLRKQAADITNINIETLRYYEKIRLINPPERTTQCLACFHWCPQKAIEIDISTINKQRYTHPDISIDDMIKSRYKKV